MKQITITPTEKEIKLVQDIAEDKRAEEIADLSGIGVGKVYENIAIAKSKYGKKTNAGLVYMFFKNGLIK